MTRKTGERALQRAVWTTLKGLDPVAWPEFTCGCAQSINSQPGQHVKWGIPDVEEGISGLRKCSHHGHGSRMAFFWPKTILTQSNIPAAVSTNILRVVNQEKEVEFSLLCNSISLVILAAKPGPHCTKEHCTNCKWVSLSLGKRSTEIAHDKIEPQPAVLVISWVTNWYTTSAETDEQSEI